MISLTNRTNFDSVNHADIHAVKNSSSQLLCFILSLRVKLAGVGCSEKITRWLLLNVNKACAPDLKKVSQSRVTWTRVRKQPIIVLYFEVESELKFYNLGVRAIKSK